MDALSEFLISGLQLRVSWYKSKGESILLKYREGHYTTIYLLFKIMTLPSVLCKHNQRWHNGVIKKKNLFFMEVNYSIALLCFHTSIRVAHCITVHLWYYSARGRPDLLSCLVIVIYVVKTLICLHVASLELVWWDFRFCNQYSCGNMTCVHKVQKVGFHKKSINNWLKSSYFLRFFIFKHSVKGANLYLVNHLFAKTRFLGRTFYNPSQVGYPS